jgi:hypothetical protein
MQTIQMISRRTVLIALAIAVTAFVVTHFLPIPGSVHEVLRATGGQLILDLKPSYSAEEVYERLMAFGDNGRAMYRRMMLSTDVIFPLSVLASWPSSQATALRRWPCQWGFVGSCSFCRLRTFCRI